MILVVVIVAAGGTFALASLRHKSGKPSSYVSSTQVILQVAEAQSMVGSSVSAGASNPPDSQQVSDQSHLVTDQANIAAVYKELGMPIGSAGTVTAAPLNSGSAYFDGTSIIVITAKSSTPQLAARLANAFATVYLASRASLYRSAATQTADATQTELSALPSGASNAATRSQLELEVVNLRAEARDPNAEASQVAAATLGVAQVTTSRSPKVYAAIGGVVGLLLAIAVAFGLSLFDRRLTRVSAIESGYGFEVLGVLPRVARAAPSRNGTPSIPRELIESLRALRITLRVSAGKNRPRTLLVTSAMPGEGKSTLARNLALVYADAGERVLLIDADMRRPSVPSMFGLDPGRGLSHVLDGVATPGDTVIHVLAPESPASTNGSQAAPHAFSAPVVGRQNDGALDVLTHGEILDDPVTALSSPAMETLLSSARDHYDIVIVDSAPILAVTDTVPLLPIVDAVLLVARLGVTTKDAAERLSDTLRRVPDVNVVGVVANDLRDTFLDSGYGGMYSGRYGGYGYRSDEHGHEIAAKAG
jgi:Mrp family chromosome partitioning ATPase/capsular polysaccharide biosynthesis protein